MSTGKLIRMLVSLAALGCFYCVEANAQNLRDFGAAGDGVTDDGPALQAALDALASAGGGILTVPPGKYAIQTPVTKDFLNLASAVIIQGTGSSSQFAIKSGAQADAIRLTNLESLLIEHLTFVGTPGVGTDAKSSLLISYCLQATIRRCDFYGLSTLVANSGVIYAYNTNLRIQGSSFRGCTGNSADGVPVVQNEQWRGLEVTDTDFMDFGTLNGVYHSKTPLAPAIAWIRVGNTGPMDANAQHRVVIWQVRMDEGAQHGFVCNPNYVVSARVANILISGLLVNGSGIDGSTGVWIQQADNVTIEQSWFGYVSPTRTSIAIYLASAGDVILDAVRCEAGMNRIVADAWTRTLFVRESVYTTLHSDAQVTLVEKSGVRAFLHRTDGPIAAHTLAEWSQTTNRRVVQAQVTSHASSIAGVALDAASTAGDYVRVVVPDGQIVPVRSDGSAAILRGDAVGVSTAAAGRVRTVSSGVQIGRAVTGVSAHTDALVFVQLLIANTANSDVVRSGAGMEEEEPPDTTPPVISAPTVAPTTLSSKGGTVTVSAIVTDDRSVATITALIVDASGGLRFVNLGATDSNIFSGTVSVAENPRKRKPQTHSITILARDAAGNEARAAGPSLTVSPKGKKEKTRARQNRMRRHVTRVGRRR